MSADVPDDTHAAPAAVPDNDDAADLGDMFGGGEADARPEPTFTEFLHERPSRTALRLVRCESTHSLWGNQLWNAARYFIEKMDDGSIDVAGKCVLEVGSGLGAPSMVAAANGARLVVATDYPDQSVIDLLERNVNANRSAMYSEISQRRGETSPLTYGTEEMLQVQPLLWGSDEHIKRVLSITGGTGYDVLILSDVVFNHVCHDALMRTVSRCLTKGPSSVAYVVFSHHRPLKVQDDLRFFTIAADYGLAVQQTDCRHDFPLMFPDDPGPAEIRQPVWCYTLKHNMDAAGAPCDEVEADVVVLGTGLVESMISAACAKSRLKVLHLEAADFYGGAFATGHRSEFERMVRRLDHRAVFATPALDQLRRVAASRDEPEDVRARAEKEARAIEATLTSRQIALDVCPFVNLADSSLVQQLAESQMGQHLEYQNVSRLAIIDATAFPTQKIFSVPLSRSAAFKSKALGPMDMRRLVALVKDLSGAPDKPEGTEGEDHVPTDPEHDEEAIVRVICRGASPDATLREVLQSNYRISAAVEELLTLGGTLVDAATTPAAAGVELLRVYVASLGKYGGATPFLVSQYGASEVPQLMCRMAAVWEAAFILKRTVAVVEASEALSRQTSEESPEASPRRPAAPKQAVATVKGVYSRSPDGSAVILSNGQRITAKVLIAPKQCAALHLASPQSHPIPSGEAWGHPRVNQIASRVVLVLKAPAVRWSALEPDPVAEDDAPELELRNAVPIPLVIGSLKFRRAPNPNIDASSSSNVSVIVNASFVQLNAASVHAPPGWSVVHLTAPASLVTPTELLEAGVAAFAPNASQDLVFSAAFTLSTDVAALQALRVDADEPLPSPLVVHWKQMATRTEDGGFNVTRVDTNAITVIPITTFSPFGLDDTRYAAEASRAFDAIKTRCGLPNDEPFLAPSPRVAADL